MPNATARCEPDESGAYRLPRGLRGFRLKARRFASTIVKSPPLAGRRVHNARKRSRAGPCEAGAARTPATPGYPGSPPRRIAAEHRSAVRP
ncbi:hypothetical protein C7S14_6032 [Burkholderia cepacia]|nr:hypothetical protein C7S14_6032 [Burkholderia cepacia]